MVRTTIARNISLEGHIKVADITMA